MPRKFNFESYYIQCARYRHQLGSRRESNRERKREEEKLRWGYKREGGSRIEEQSGQGSRGEEEEAKRSEDLQSSK